MSKTGGTEPNRQVAQSDPAADLMRSWSVERPSGMGGHPAQGSSPAGPTLASSVRTANTAFLGGPGLDPVDIYLRQIGKVELLDAERELELAKRIEAGLFAEHKIGEGGRMDPQRRRDLARIAEEGRTAKSTLIQANLRLVVYVAKRYPRGGLDLLDLIQEGNVGLIHAVEKFDFTKGVRFSTYATHWIRQALQRGAHQGRPIQLPHRVGAKLRAIQLARESLKAEIPRTRSRLALAQRAGMSRAELDNLLALPTVVVSLDALRPVHWQPGRRWINDDEWNAEWFAPRYDVLVGPPTVADQAIAPAGKCIREAISTLSPRQADVVRLRYGFDEDGPLSGSDVGRRFGVTAERIRQIEGLALSRLKGRLRDRSGGRCPRCWRGTLS
ncbi:sigma-70 family RNA polymerase sigma factor [Terrabacter ginsenosidimutans]|uniref:RNA polymerase sigma factor n=1 Tax=Terrabacter ginsenosidimutans TaxID=490575 RepID=A0ABP7ECV2_9MICO